MCSQQVRDGRHPHPPDGIFLAQIFRSSSSVDHAAVYPERKYRELGSPQELPIIEHLSLQTGLGAQVLPPSQSSFPSPSHISFLNRRGEARVVRVRLRNRSGMGGFHTVHMAKFVCSCLPPSAQLLTPPGSTSYGSEAKHVMVQLGPSGRAFLFRTSRPTNRSSCSGYSAFHIHVSFIPHQL